MKMGMVFELGSRGSELTASESLAWCCHLARSMAQPARERRHWGGPTCLPGVTGPAHQLRGTFAGSTDFGSKSRPRICAASAAGIAVSK